MATNNMTADYIQFSKKVTRWGITLVTIILIICIAAIVFKTFEPYVINAITSLYTSYITIMGITIGAYQGNSSLEKWTRAKYQFELAAKTSQIDDEDESIIENIEDTYG